MFGVDKEQNGRYHVVNSVTNTGRLLGRYLVTHLTGIDDDGPRDSRHKQRHLKAQRSYHSEVRVHVLRVAGPAQAGSVRRLCGAALALRRMHV